MGFDPILAELIRSLEIRDLVRELWFQNWDLSSILATLMQDPLESLHNVSVLHLQGEMYICLPWQQQKVSESHALAMDSEQSRFIKSGGSMSLRIQSGPLAKIHYHLNAQVVF